MRPSEFDLIRQYFQKSFISTPDIICGIGDDAAVVTVPASTELALSMDTLVSGVHFHPSTPPEHIGYKSLAVNLSDMAAMGAEPKWITMSLTVPQADHQWLNQFMVGFNLLASHFQVSLVGGDLTRGPLSITLQLHGWLPAGHAIRRSGAHKGDQIYVSGTLGDAGLALQVLENNCTVPDEFKNYLLGRLQRPAPRIDLGMALRGIATSAIDLSDGLAADLEHILDASGSGAEVYIDKLPFSDPLAKRQDKEIWKLAVTAGDDYELCFTVPPEKVNVLDSLSKADCPLTCIGQIIDQSGIHWLANDGSHHSLEKTGYRHF